MSTTLEDSESRFHKYLNETNDHLYNLLDEWIRSRHDKLVVIDFKSNGTEEETNYFIHKLIEAFQHQVFSSLTPSLTALFGLVYAIVTTFGLVSNLAIIYVFCRNQKLRTFRNMFIINLAVR